MPEEKYRFKLTDEERKALNEMVEKGKNSARKIVDALILLNCDEESTHNPTDEELCRFLKIGKLRAHNVRKRFCEGGLDKVFEHLHGGGRLKRIDGDFEAHIIAISCGEPPAGFSQWSLRLLADQAVELQYIDHVSHETIRQLLKKTNSSLGKKMNG